MRESDIQEFSKILSDVAELLGRPDPGARQTALFFRAMSTYSMESVRSALDAHLRDTKRGRFFPAPADLIEKIEGQASDDGRPGAEEAWAIAIKASDELETVIWTDEICEAWGICRDVWNSGDQIGARMAFKEAYDRIVLVARRERKMVRWTASMGFDKEKRAIAMTKAAEQGRLIGSEAMQIAHDTAKPLMLEDLSKSEIAPEFRRKLKDIFDEIYSKPKVEPESDHEKTQKLKKKMSEKVEDYVKQNREG